MNISAMHDWENRAVALLDKCFSGTPTELNELDWKENISTNTERLTEHISAFANYSEGGFIVFGIKDDATFGNINSSTCESIVSKMGSIARQSFSYAVQLEFSNILYHGSNLLVVYVKENAHKPVSIKKNGVWDAYIRSAKQTVRMSENEIRNMIAISEGIPFEKKISRGKLTAKEVLDTLSYKTFISLLELNPKLSEEKLIEKFIEEGFVTQIPNTTLFNVTNLGAIVLSKDLKQEGILRHKYIRVIHYKGTNKLNTIKDQDGGLGYAIAFPKLIQYLMDLLPVNEVINTSLRKMVHVYPELAIREFVANALIHQDFYITGSNVIIEIYDDRMEITNPGVPIIDIDRFIDTPPRARNVAMSEFLRRCGICEKRGSGVQRSLEAIEAFQLPAPKFIRGEDYTKVILYAPKKYKNMTQEDKIRACYQHTVLRYVSSLKVNNESVRARFNINKNNAATASKILNDTVKAGWIKYADPNNESTKHRTYIPNWA